VKSTTAAVKTRRLPTSRFTSTASWKAYVRLAEGRCAYCHAPASRGGQNAPENLLPICTECNTLKGDSTLAQFVGEWESPHGDLIPHPLGTIVKGQWVWSANARRIQDARNRAHAAQNPSVAAAPAKRKRGERGLRKPRRFIAAASATAAPVVSVHRTATLGDIAYAAAYDFEGCLGQLRLRDGGRPSVAGGRERRRGRTRQAAAGLARSAA
jgi:hypothetical protein